MVNWKVSPRGLNMQKVSKTQLIDLYLLSLKLVTQLFFMVTANQSKFITSYPKKL